MTKLMTIAAIAAVCSLPGCAPDSNETPAESIRAIVALFEARDFDTLIRTRYAEIWKADSEEQIQMLIDRFESRFEGDDALGQAIATYNSALELTPEISGDSLATYTLEAGTIRLSKMPDGLWGFHL